MGKIIRFIRRHLPTQRRLIQLYSALLYNAHLKGFISGNIYTGKGKMLCLPGLNCYSCPGATGACPLGALQNAVASSGSRTPTYILGILLLFGLTLGRTICGYLCPFGLLQELLHKLPTPKVGKSLITRVLSYTKYVFLFIFVLLIPFWYALQSYPVPAFCKYICPAGTLEGAVGLLSNPINADKYSMLGLLFTRKFLILGIILVACIFFYRAFCRFLCPLGAIYGLFSRLALIGVKIDTARCVDCGHCVTNCPMDIRHVSDHECIHCGQCIPVCPTNAISFKAGKYTIQAPNQAAANRSVMKQIKRRRLIAWGVALSFLFLTLYVVNADSIRPPASENFANQADEEALLTTQVPVGKDPGMLAPDFSVPVYGTDIPFVLSEHRGRRVIINFWATWCTPCCNELPYFDEAYQQHQENATIIAIHSDLVTDDVEAYLSRFDYQLPFALDQTGEVIKQFGGSTMLPLTIVIDENGIIVYNAVGSVTPQQLESFLIMNE